MLDMFKRPGDPEEHARLYAIPAVAFSALYLGLSALFPSVGFTKMAYVASSLCCVAGIGGLSSQKTARLGNALGMVGVGTGIFVALSSLAPSFSHLIQMFGLLGVGF
ncbi:hypothetical protein MHBO_005153 [Bonamia ostreae]|uniref:proton-translocating NAD(P)(+) transhydrogenase n=1 Tax=Bonamia ostreae TaxID=126728 RepID=A0ABV2AW27_9EUKA